MLKYNVPSQVCSVRNTDIKRKDVRELRIEQTILTVQIDCEYLRCTNVFFDVVFLFLMEKCLFPRQKIF